MREHPPLLFFRSATGHSMKKIVKPRVYVAETKDTRFPGTYEVLVAVPDRVKPHRVAQQFASLQAAEAWMHSAEGRDVIDNVTK